MATQTQQGTVRLHKDGATVTFQVIGLGRMYQSMPVRRFCEQYLAEDATTFRVDLRHCTYVDSTFLGTLLLLRRNVQRRQGCRFVVVSPSAECSRIFKQMGVEDCLPTVADSEPPDEAWTEVPCETSVEIFNRNVVQAHQELASVGGTCGDTFAGVARGLKKDTDSDDIP